MIDKKRLRAFRSMSNEIRYLDQTIQAMRETCGAKTSKFGADAGGGSHDGTATELTVEKMIKLEEKYNRTKAEYLNERIQIENAMGCLEPDERALIRLYYFDNYTWEETANLLRYSYQHVHRKHASALQKLTNLKGDTENDYQSGEL